MLNGKRFEIFLHNVVKVDTYKKLHFNKFCLISRIHEEWSLFKRSYLFYKKAEKEWSVFKKNLSFFIKK